MKRWQRTLLIVELGLIALILVMPQVTLPAFVSHGKSAPMTAKSDLQHLPPRVAIIYPKITAPAATIVAYLRDAAEATVSPSLSSSLSFLCTLLC